MVVKLRLLLDWACWPVWLYNEEDDIVDTALPEDLRQADRELEAIFDDLQARYDALFENTKHVFQWIGFRSASEEARFREDWRKAVDRLTAAAAGKYTIVDDVLLTFPGWKS